MTQGTTFWRSVEAVHAVVYFAPDTKERYETIGLKGYWMGYLASRSAAVGTPRRFQGRSASLDPTQVQRA